MPSVYKVEFDTNLVPRCTRNFSHLICLAWVNVPSCVATIQVEYSPDVVAEDNVDVKSTSYTGIKISATVIRDEYILGCIQSSNLE